MTDLAQVVPEVQTTLPEITREQIRCVKDFSRKLYELKGNTPYACDIDMYDSKQCGEKHPKLDNAFESLEYVSDHKKILQTLACMQNMVEHFPQLLKSHSKPSEWYVALKCELDSLVLVIDIIGKYIIQRRAASKAERDAKKDVEETPEVKEIKTMEVSDISTLASYILELKRSQYEKTKSVTYCPNPPKSVVKNFIQHINTLYILTCIHTDLFETENMTTLCKHIESLVARKYTSYDINIFMNSCVSVLMFILEIKSINEKVHYEREFLKEMEEFLSMFSKPKTDEKVETVPVKKKRTCKNLLVSGLKNYYFRKSMEEKKLSAIIKKLDDVSLVRFNEAYTKLYTRAELISILAEEMKKQTDMNKFAQASIPTLDSKLSETNFELQQIIFSIKHAIKHISPDVFFTIGVKELEKLVMTFYDVAMTEKTIESVLIATDKQRNIILEYLSKKQERSLRACFTNNEL